METTEEVDYIKGFKDDLLLNGVSPDVVKNYPITVRNLQLFLNGKSLLEVDDAVLTSYLAHLKRKNLKPSTLTTYFTALSTFYNYLIWRKIIDKNPILPFRNHYRKSFNRHDVSQRRQIISVQQASMFVKSVFNPKDKAAILFLFKTGMRRHELSDLDVNDVNFDNQTIHIKETAKRSNVVVYFDQETSNILQIWLKRREKLNTKHSQALFIDRNGDRLSPQAIDIMFVKHATACGLHKPDSSRLEDKLTPHCARHWFTTQLLDNDMPRHYIAELRGDHYHDIIDVYSHIDRAKLKEAYMAKIPKLNIR